MKSIINFLVIVLVGFATLDGLRDTFLQNNPISYVKEFASVILLLLLLLKAFGSNTKINSTFIILCNFFALFVLVICFATTKYALTSLTRGTLSFGGWSVWVKLLSFYCLMNCLFFIRIMYEDIYYSIPRLYIKFTMVYCLATIFFISTGLSSHLPQRNWSGRLSIGYPTMDSLVLIVAIIFSIYFLHKKTARIFSIAVFTGVLLMQNTASGYMMLLMLFLFSIFFMKGFYKVLSLVFVSCFCLIGFYIYNYWYVNMGDYGILLVDKINGFVLGNDTSSIEIRQQQISTLMNDMNSYLLYVIFGKGGDEAYLVENTYYALYGCVGVVGISLFLLLFVFFFLKIPKSFSNSTYYSHGIIISVVYLISCAGLIGFYLFPMIFILAYLVSLYSFSEASHEQIIKAL